MTISDRNTTYVPGIGYSAVMKDGPAGKICRRWGKEFVDNTRKQLIQKAAEAAQNVSPRAKLTGEDIKELAAKYDPSSMTHDEYDAFLNDLVEKGVLSHKEISYMGYQGLVYLKPIKDNRPVTGVPIDLNDPIAYRWMYSGYSSGSPIKFGDSSQDNLNVLEWSRLKDMFTPSESKAKESYYGVLYDVVKRMASAHG